MTGVNVMETRPLLCVKAKPQVSEIEK